MCAVFMIIIHITQLQCDRWTNNIRTQVNGNMKNTYISMAQYRRACTPIRTKWGICPNQQNDGSHPEVKGLEKDMQGLR